MPRKTHESPELRKKQLKRDFLQPQDDEPSPYFPLQDLIDGDQEEMKSQRRRLTTEPKTTKQKRREFNIHVCVLDHQKEKETDNSESWMNEMVDTPSTIKNLNVPSANPGEALRRISTNVGGRDKHKSE